MERGCGTMEESNASKKAENFQVSRRALHENYLNYFNEKNSLGPGLGLHDSRFRYRRPLRQRRIERFLYRI